MRGHVLSLLFLEGRGRPFVAHGSAPRSVAVNPTGSPQWSSNRHGVCVTSPDTLTSWNFHNTDLWLPTDEVTIAIVRRKTDTVNRASSLFGVGTSIAGERCGAHVPYSDGTVYWDFGGTGAGNRISVSGLSFSTTHPERWIFSAGPKGSAIWQNGVKVASSTTPISRSASSSQFSLNGGNGFLSAGPDVEDFNAFILVRDQWSDDLCRWWSAAPYAHLTRRVVIADFGGGAAPSGPVFPALTLAW